MSMLLTSEDGKQFELALLADRLPEAQDGFGDDHASTISFRVATADDEWEETAPTVNLHELRALREWLQSVAEGEPSQPEMDILEPELNFQLVKDLGDRVQLRVRFHLADRPDELALDGDTDAGHVDIRTDRATIGAAAAQLAADINDIAGDLKDDLTAAEDPGFGALPDTANPAETSQVSLDQESPLPQGAGEGEDNAGNR